MSQSVIFVQTTEVTRHQKFTGLDKIPSFEFHRRTEDGILMSIYQYQWNKKNLFVYQGRRVCQTKRIVNGIRMF